MNNLYKYFGVSEYQIKALSLMKKRIDFKKKKVLEIGGSNLPSTLVLNDLGVSQWICVDYMPMAFDAQRSKNHYSHEIILPLNENNYKKDSKYQIFDGKAENIPSCFYEEFDVVVSITALEHMSNLMKVLRIISHCLKKKGIFLSYHGPIWSCYCGHHCWVSPDLNFNSLGYIPEFGHLLLTPPEMYTLLIEYYDKEKVEETIFQIYYSNRINRLFYEDYEKFFLLSNFSKIEINSYYTKQPIKNIQNRLMELYPKYKNFSSYGLFCHIEK